MITQTNYSLLFVEDEAMIRRIAIAFLNPFFIKIYEAKDGVEALEVYEKYKPDIIITDIEMPNMNGLELCRKIRKDDKITPIIITTAYTTTEYLLEAVELNLVKYVVKPIKEERLLSALNLCFEQIQREKPSIVHLSNVYKFDMLNHTLIKNNTIVPLTESQYKFLTILIKNRGKIVSYDEIEHYVWSNKFMSSNALRSLVRDVRKLVGKEVISNISKYGYKIYLYE